MYIYIHMFVYIYIYKYIEHFVNEPHSFEGAGFVLSSVSVSTGNRIFCQTNDIKLFFYPFSFDRFPAERTLRINATFKVFSQTGPLSILSGR